MNLKNNSLLRLSLIGAIALATVPSVPGVSFAAGGSADRCAGTAIIGDARIEAGRDNFFAGYVPVNTTGYFHWNCATAAGVTEEGTDCGAPSDRMRLVYAELRNGVLYVDCN